MADLQFSLTKTLPTNRPVETREGLGIVLFAGLILFLLALAIFGGIFFYKRLLSTKIEELNVSLKRLEADFELPLVTELADTSKKIEAAKILLSSHISASRVFEFLENNTLSSVAFSSFNFNDKDFSVAMAGETKDYTTLAQQTSIFEKNNLVKQVTLSNPTLNAVGGITFNLVIIFDSSIATFR